MLLIKPVKVLIIGDSFLDQYVNGEVKRISQEAPVPIFNVSYKERNHASRLGGAANTAANVAALGGKATLITVLGEDEGSNVFSALAENAGIRLLQFSDGRETSRKVRLLANGQQLMRMDYESTDEMMLSDLTDHLWQTIEEEIAKADIVIISDYAKGFVPAWLSAEIIETCAKRRIQSVVDPKARNCAGYNNASYVTPNEKEMLEMVPGVHDPEQAACQFSLDESCVVLLTKGASGVSLIYDTVHGRFPAEAKEVFDITGAGDTFVAAFSLAMASGSDEVSAIKFAIKAAGVSVGKFGTSTVSLNEVGDLRGESGEGGAV